MAQPARAARLAVTAIAGQGIAYLLAVLLAQRLGVAGFEAYAVSGAVFALMATFAPRGIEKYALRALPALLERADWPGTRGFLRFGLRRTLVNALLVGAGVAAWVTLLGDLADATRWAIVVSCVTLPAGALVQYGLEVLSASGREVRALTLYRVATPALALLFVLVLLALAVDLSGAIAAGCWGAAWVLVLGLMALEARRTLPLAVLRAAPAQDAARWQAEARPFFIYRLSLALLGHTGVLALNALQPSAAAVGAYAVAMGTVSLAAVLATATNRAYARRLSILLERHDFATLQALRRERLRWLLPAVGVFLVLSFAFTREVLALFRPEFAEVGVVPLRVLALSTAFTVLLSLAPTYLKFRQRNRSTYAVVGSAAAAQGVLLLWLVPAHGATGAALAYAVSMCGMYGAFAWMAHRELLQFKG